MSAAFAAVLVLAVPPGGVPGPAVAATVDTATQASPTPGANRRTPYERKLERLHAIGWRLAAANARWCGRTVADIGWLLHDARTYPDPAAMRARHGAEIWVQAVAPGSPAYRAGLAPGDAPQRAGGLPIASAPPGDPSWQRLIELNENLARTFEDGRARIEWIRDGRAYAAQVLPRRICPAAFELRASKDNAIADRRRVMLGEEFPGFEWADAELAAIVAHELAHVILAHDPRRSSAEDIRQMERIADRLMPWLLANAGYDPDAAASAMTRIGPSLDRGLRLRPRHDRWRDRVAAIRDEAALVARFREEERPLDWRARLSAP